MNGPYWCYETSIGNTLAVSIRSTGDCSSTEYYLYLAKFIYAYRHRITNINDVSRLAGTIFDQREQYCCIINLSSREEIKFDNKRH